MRAILRARHYSRRTEESYVAWIRRYIHFHGRRHPADLGEPELTRFLSALATERQVSASTQNQALAALLFLYQTVLEARSPGWRESSTPNAPNVCRSSSRAARSLPSSRR